MLPNNALRFESKGPCSHLISPTVMKVDHDSFSSSVDILAMEKEAEGPLDGLLKVGAKS